MIALDFLIACAPLFVLCALWVVEDRSDRREPSQLLHRLPEQLWAIKGAASQAMIDAGGTITHNHVLGRDRRGWYEQQRPALFAEAFKCAKQ